MMTLLNHTCILSKKPGNYNGTFISFFDIAVRKKLYPIHSKFTFLTCRKQNVTSFFSVNQNKPNNKNICEKVKFDKDLSKF